jgi:hypothetical protein
VTRYPVRVVPDVWKPGYQGLPPFEPWRPFRLAAGGEAVIEMEATQERGCIERNASLGWNSEPVGFSVFGIPRQTDFTPNVEVRFVGTEPCG